MSATTDAHLLRVALKSYRHLAGADPQFKAQFDSYETFRRKLQRSKSLRRQVIALVKRSHGSLALALLYSTVQKPRGGIPRALSLVVHGEPPPPGVDPYFIFLGEIPNMPGHCAVLRSDGKTEIGYHTGDFRELTANEV